MDPSWISLIPFLIVIPISIITKQVQPGLFVALLVGSYLVDPSLLGGIQKFLTYIVHTTVVSNNIRIIIFLYAFAGLINIIKMAGGIKGFVELVSTKVKTKKSAMLLTWISTIGTFSDPDFRIVTIAPIMKALKDRLKMSSRRIGIVIEVTSNPIVALVPVATGFVGYMVATIHTSLKHAGINQPAYLTYVKSIPFNFFSFSIIAVGIYYTFFMHQKHEKKFHFNAQEKAEAENEARKSGEGVNQNNGVPMQPAPTPSPVMADNSGSGGGQPSFTNANSTNPTSGFQMTNIAPPTGNAPIQQPLKANNLNQIPGMEATHSVMNPSMNTGQNPGQAQSPQTLGQNFGQINNPNTVPSQPMQPVNPMGQQPFNTGMQNMSNNSGQTVPNGQSTINNSNPPSPVAGQGSINNINQPVPLGGQNLINNVGGQAPISNTGTQLPPTNNQNMINNGVQQNPVVTANPEVFQPTGMQPINQINGQYNEEYSRNLDASTMVTNGPHVEKMTNPNEKQGEEDLQKEQKGYDDKTPSRPWNLILPLATVLLLTLFLSWWDGHYKSNTFFGAFIRVDALGVMLEAVLITLILTVVFFMVQRFSVAKIVTHFIKGGNQLMSVVVLLALIWGVSAVSEDLGFSKYITIHVEGWIPSSLVAPVLFLLGGLISYFIGSSWGTWGLLMPLGIMLAHHAHANLLLVIGAVFASGTFGAFASPLSDNTVTLCTILDLPVMEYAKSKLVPSLIAAGIACILFVAFSFIL
jgi:Na+/H+ antiporter NhaC